MGTLLAQFLGAKMFRVTGGKYLCRSFDRAGNVSTKKSTDGFYPGRCYRVKLFTPATLITAIRLNVAFCIPVMLLSVVLLLPSLFQQYVPTSIQVNKKQKSHLWICTPNCLIKLVPLTVLERFSNSLPKAA